MTTDTDELIKALHEQRQPDAKPDSYEQGRNDGLTAAIAIVRRHTEGRPAVEGKPLELMTRDELLSYIRHSAKRDAMPAEGCEPGELKYLREWHYVTQHLIGAVGLYCGREELEKARDRFYHYRDKLPKRDYLNNTSHKEG
jgi:hypothetical protein